jgi:hypothetical protein
VLDIIKIAGAFNYQKALKAKSILKWFPISKFLLFPDVNLLKLCPCCAGLEKTYLSKLSVSSRIKKEIKVSSILKFLTIYSLILRNYRTNHLNKLLRQ